MRCSVGRRASALWRMPRSSARRRSVSRSMSSTIEFAPATSCRCRRRSSDLIQSIDLRRASTPTKVRIDPRIVSIRSGRVHRLRNTSWTMSSVIDGAWVIRSTVVRTNPSSTRCTSTRACSSPAQSRASTIESQPSSPYTGIRARRSAGLAARNRASELCVGGGASTSSTMEVLRVRVGVIIARRCILC